jgi:hypothetical protein
MIQGIFISIFHETKGNELAEIILMSANHSRQRQMKSAHAQHVIHDENFRQEECIQETGWKNQV